VGGAGTGAAGTRNAGPVTVVSLLIRCVWLVTGCVILALGSACANEDAAGAVPRQSIPTPHPTATAAAPATPTTIPLHSAVQAAIAQAAADAGVDVDTVELISYQGEEWSSAALGCPQPGKFYAQVITPGYSVVLRVSGVEREYHTDLSDRVVSCDEVAQ
jgi:hypothetical protein